MIPDAAGLDTPHMLDAYAWALVKRFDKRAANAYFVSIDDVEGYLRARHRFVLGVLTDIAALPGTLQEGAR